MNGDPYGTRTTRPEIWDRLDHEQRPGVLEDLRVRF